MDDKSDEAYAARQKMCSEMIVRWEHDERAIRAWLDSLGSGPLSGE